MNILIPMAGAGSRFVSAGYQDSKPLIDVNGLPMIIRVIDNLGPIGRYIFIVRKDLHDYDRLICLLKSVKKDAIIVELNELTEGAAQTCLYANKALNGYLDNDSLLVANCDQIQNWSSNDFEKAISNSTDDGIIVTFNSRDKNNSYALLDENKSVIKVAEKEVISNVATTGVYYWRRGSDFIRDATQMISKNIRTNNEFYVCPVYNETISNYGKVSTYQIENHWPIGTPEELKKYLAKNK